MANIQIIVGSMLGGTEYVAEACQEALNDLNIQSDLHFQPNFLEILHKGTTWLICTSTHGAGDYPDNIQAFVKELESSKDDLSSINFWVIGTGDSSYDTYCYAAKNISNLLKSKGCSEIIELKTLNILDEEDPEEIAQQWISFNKDLLIQS
ncbi:FMN-binding protein MioC [Thalassotalea profundi]|uniref:FMN-binding protein MioC n=1 Tax=Thalassotalea profundi TaxID=2036687 RepID=A0ABQ3J1V5_9GAMM|nr:FMN-binding protein MioC [Thalassotalea profundi]GHE96266.1 FMN-binding protein MioC [Thalassotalea profundi]